MKEIKNVLSECQDNIEKAHKSLGLFYHDLNNSSVSESEFKKRVFIIWLEVDTVKEHLEKLGNLINEEYFRQLDQEQV